MKTASKLIALTSLGLATLLGGGCDNPKENTKFDVAAYGERSKEKT